MNLKGKRVLITGATGGIGHAICLALIDAGCNLVLIGRDPKKLEQVINHFPETNNYLYIEADMSITGNIKLIHQECQQLKEEGINIDIVINNAGCNTFDYLSQRTDDSIEKEIALNLTAPILLSKYALSWISPTGFIVNIGSTFAGIGYPGYATYCATKAGLHRFTEAMQRELNDCGQQVLFVAPRATDTGLNDQRVINLNKEVGTNSDSPNYVAAQVLIALQSEKKVSWIGWPEKLFVRVNQLFPSLVSNSLYKQKDIIAKYLKSTNNT